MSRMVGTVSRGIRAPIIRSGDDLAEIVTQSVLEAAVQPVDGFEVRDRDVVAMTEAIVARAQGNYATVQRHRRGCEGEAGRRDGGRHFPHPQPEPLCRLPAGHRHGCPERLSSMLSYPSDEVGNHLIDPDVMEEKGVDPYRDVLTLAQYRALFGIHRASLHRGGLCGLLHGAHPRLRCGGGGDLCQ